MTVAIRLSQTKIRLLRAAPVAGPSASTGGAALIPREASVQATVDGAQIVFLSPPAVAGTQTLYINGLRQPRADISFSTTQAVVPLSQLVRAGDWLTVEYQSLT